MIPPELDGTAIPSGCEDCNAEQRMVQVMPGVWSLGIYHDDTCPVWQAMQGDPPPDAA